MHDPFAPWHLVAMAMAGAASLALLARLVRPDRWLVLARNPKAAGLAGLLSLLSLALLAWTLWNPKLVRRGGSAEYHLEVLLDVSDSMRRDVAAWSRCKKQSTDWLAALANDTPARSRKSITLGFTTVGRSAATGPRTHLGDAARSFAALKASDFAPGDATDLATGIERAGERVAAAGGRGLIILISDGQATDGDATTAASELGARGIPLIILPADGSPPALSVAAADLPPFIDTGTATRLRGSLANQLDRDVTATLRIETNPGLDAAQGPHGVRLETTQEVELSAGQFTRFRPELTFQGYGLQCVDFELSEPGSPRPPQRRRFYTQVVRPPRLLALGDNSWLASLADSEFDVIQKRPEELTADMNLADVDAVVLSGISGQRFSPEVHDALRSAVESGGLGLFFINGGHAGRERDPSILSSYADTAIGGLLPVEPRKSTWDPPSRHVILMLDTSGSMGGWEVDMKRIARHIVDKLRPSDKLDVIAFTVSARQPVKDMVMTPSNKKKAIMAIDSLAITGGTSPREAMTLIEKREFEEGGLIFISDGGFSPADVDESIRRRPDLRVTVFACGNNSYNTLQKLADPIFVNRGFNPDNVEIPYFGKKEQGRYFEREVFIPLPMPDVPRDSRLPLPSLDVPGSAYSSLRDDAVLIGVRPRLAHPLLATRRAIAGRSGAWLSQLDEAWLAAPEGRAAVEQWVRSMVGFDQRDRYEFRIQTAGRRLQVTASLLPVEAGIPKIDRLDARVRLPGNQTITLPLQPDPEIRGRFVGSFEQPASDTTIRAFLEIAEEGEDALPGRQQIPWVLPPALSAPPSANREPWTHGNNPAILKQLAGLSGGSVAPAPSRSLIRNERAILRETLLWPLISLVGAACMLIAVGLRRLGG